MKTYMLYITNSFKLYILKVHIILEIKQNSLLCQRIFSPHPGPLSGCFFVLRKSKYLCKRRRSTVGEESVPGTQQVVPPFILVQVWLLHPDVYCFLDTPLFPVRLLIKDFYVVNVQFMFVVNYMVCHGRGFCT